jgi:predicted outer membrane lipoprotein
MFRLDDQDAAALIHEPRCKCSGCSSLRPALWGVYTGLMDYDFEIAKKDMEEDDEDLVPDPFMREELELGLILAAAFGVALATALPIVDRMFRPPVSSQKILAGLDDMAAIMSNAITPDVERRIDQVVARSISYGVLDSDASVGGRRPDRPASVRGVLLGSTAAFAGTVLENAPSAALVRQGIVASSKYYTNRFFNTFIIPEITSRVDRLLAGTPFNEVANLSALREVLDRRLKTVPYWRLVANAGASRAYHYGYLKAAELRGVTQYRFTAVLDEKTSEICRHMDGKVFSVSTASRLMEKVAEAPDIEQVKTLMPWLSFKEVRDLSDDELERLGVITPPLHGNCRSTLVIL